MTQRRQSWQANPEWDDDEDTNVEEITDAEGDDDEEPLLRFAAQSKRKSYTEPHILIDRIHDYDHARGQRRGEVDYYDTTHSFPSMLGLHIALATTKTLEPLSLAYEDVRKERIVAKKQQASEDMVFVTELAGVKNRDLPHDHHQCRKEGMNKSVRKTAKKLLGSLSSCKCELGDL